MMSVEEYHEYTRECSVHWRNTMSTAGDTMMSVNDIMNIPGFPYKFNGFINELPHINHGVFPAYS